MYVNTCHFPTGALCKKTLNVIQEDRNDLSLHLFKSDLTLLLFYFYFLLFYDIADCSIW
jgi:hypothetical protein